MARRSPAVEARKRLEADLAADDISIEQYAREEARIDAGSDKSEYLSAARRQFTIRRALRAGTLAAVILIAAFVLLVVSLTGRTGQSVDPPSNPSVAPSPAPTQAAPQVPPQQFDDDDFEEDDD